MNAEYLTAVAAPAHDGAAPMDPRTVFSTYVPLAAYSVLTLLSGARLYVHRLRGCDVRRCRRRSASGGGIFSASKFWFHLFLFAFAVGRTVASTLAVIPASAGLSREPAAVMNSLSGCSYITLLLFLEMHWREILSPLSSVKAKYVLATWGAFWTANVALYAVIGSSLYIEWTSSHGSRDLYWSNAVTDILLVIIAVSYTFTALGLYVRISGSLGSMKKQQLQQQQQLKDASRSNELVKRGASRKKKSWFASLFSGGSKEKSKHSALASDDAYAVIGYNHAPDYTDLTASSLEDAAAIDDALLDVAVPISSESSGAKAAPSTSKSAAAKGRRRSGGVGSPLLQPSSASSLSASGAGDRLSGESSLSSSGRAGRYGSFSAAPAPASSASASTAAAAAASSATAPTLLRPKSSASLHSSASSDPPSPAPASSSSSFSGREGGFSRSAASSGTPSQASWHSGHSQQQQLPSPLPNDDATGFSSYLAAQLNATPSIRPLTAAAAVASPSLRATTGLSRGYYSASVAAAAVAAADRQSKRATKAKSGGLFGRSRGKSGAAVDDDVEAAALAIDDADEGADFRQPAVPSGSDSPITRSVSASSGRKSISLPRSSSSNAIVPKRTPALTASSSSSALLSSKKGAKRLSSEEPSHQPLFGAYLLRFSNSLALLLGFVCAFSPFIYSLCSTYLFPNRLLQTWLA